MYVAIRRMKGKPVVFDEALRRIENGNTQKPPRSSSH